jgi:O-antigen ligase
VHPNFLATFVLGAYPLFVVALYLTCRPALATALSFLVGEMFLPTAYSLPLASPTWLGKAAIPPLATLFVALFLGRRSFFRGTRPLRGIEALFLLQVVIRFLTMWTNQDALHYGPVTLQGERFVDFVSDTLRTTVVAWAAFFLGRVMFRNTRDLMTLARLLVIAALVYCLPILVEVRMSPQINVWVYGYSAFPEFGQHIRWGGYRPVVFMSHGLALSMFMLVCTFMAASLSRARQSVLGLPVRPLYWFLIFILVLCKSTGSILYGVALLPLVSFAAPKRGLTVAAVLALVVLVYPLLRFADLVPTDRIVAFFTSIAPERGQSLEYRFDMEAQMLKLTQSRPWFGWGGYGRTFLYDIYSGKRVTVVDGMVIAELSSRGLVGFLAFLGPLVWSVVRAARATRRIATRTTRMVMSALVLACGVILFDLIINSTLTPPFILMLGALNGLVPGIRAEEERALALEDSDLDADAEAAFHDDGYGRAALP